MSARVFERDQALPPAVIWRRNTKFMGYRSSAKFVSLAPMILSLRNTIHEVAPELQFWGYEGGNLIAAVAGAGGFLAFYNGMKSVGAIPSEDPMTGLASAISLYPDIIVTTGLALIVLATIAAGSILGREKNHRIKIWIDRSASVVGLWLVGAALYFGASWITFTAVSFVSASALLRLCRTSPVFLKLGGLMLAAGGIGLAGFGLSSIQGFQSILLPCLTILTGVYVVFASLMTYQGGMYECDASRNDASSQQFHMGIFHPAGWVGHLLETRFDRPVCSLVKSVALPLVFWVPHSIKTNSPFLTSMWTRLPWRLLTGIAALATGTTVGVLFGVANVFWAIGDIAIGSLDWDVADH